MIKLQERFLLARRTEPVGRGKIYSHSRHPKQGTSSACDVFSCLSFSGTVWTPRIRRHLPSIQWFPEASDLRSKVVQVSPRRTVETTFGVSDFGWWKGLRWNPLILAFLEPLVLRPLQGSISAVADCANGLRNLKRGLSFTCTKLLLCSVSAYLKESQRTGSGVASYRCWCSACNGRKVLRRFPAYSDCSLNRIHSHIDLFFMPASRPCWGAAWSSAVNKSWPCSERAHGDTHPDP